MQRLLSKLYYDERKPSFLAGSSTLLNEAKKYNPKINRKNIEKFLFKQKVYTTHAEINRRKKVQSKYVSTFAMKNLHIDTIVFSRKLYFLSACCTFSNYSACEFVGYSKKASSILRAFKRLFTKLPLKPTVVSSDSGTEMAQIPKFLSAHSIEFVQLKSYQHSYQAERLNHSIRSIFRKIKTYKGHGDIRRLMPRIISQINRIKSRVTKLTPLQMLKPQYAGRVFKSRYSNYLKDKKDAHGHYQFKVNDSVRLYNFLSASEKSNILKAKASRYTPEIFYVDKILPNTYPPSYLVRDNKGVQINRPIKQYHLIRAGNQNND